MEIVEVTSLDRARGTQLGLVYELRWELDGPALTVDVGAARSPTCSTAPTSSTCSIRRSSTPCRSCGTGCWPRPRSRDYTMRFVAVPDLTAVLGPQRYAPRGGRTVHFVAGDFAADIDFDDDGFVVLYHDYLRRLHP
ncbi:hypothetical protein CRM89_08225 [Nocardia sp. FDAARGOS_372]|nr:hypothetical protein CRM89_08225 [Nocardia sp. FDAARGOS_372]